MEGEHIVPAGMREDTRQWRDTVERERVRAHRASRAHSQTSYELRWMHNHQGLSAVVLSTISGAAVFSTLSASPQLEVTAIAWLLSLTAAASSSPRTFSYFIARAERPRLFGALYAGLKRSIDALLIDAGRRPSRVDALVSRLNHLDKSDPTPQTLLWSVALGAGAGFRRNMMKRGSLRRYSQ